jgi:hypothetical protein
MTIHPSLPWEVMIDHIQRDPPHRWPAGWAHWPNTIEAHRRLAEQFIAQIDGHLTIPSVGEVPERGIVMAGGGPKYFPSVWVNVHLIRYLGCDLPIQLWHLGESELDQRMRNLLQPLGVDFRDALELAREIPCRILNGWELKIYATIHAPFAEVLYLDADNSPVRDIRFLFDTAAYREGGAVFWPDYACWTLKPEIWEVFGMPHLGQCQRTRCEPGFESGQYLVNKRRCLRELSLALWYAEHSDFTFQHVYGDKECFHLAWRKLGTDYAMPRRPPGWNEHTVLQYDFEDQLVFQHRCHDKWQLEGNRRVDSLVNESLCFELIRELADLWKPGR